MTPATHLFVSYEASRFDSNVQLTVHRGGDMLRTPHSKHGLLLGWLSLSVFEQYLSYGCSGSVKPESKY
jgi:hypothetical protein